MKCAGCGTAVVVREVEGKKTLICHGCGTRASSAALAVRAFVSLKRDGRQKVCELPVEVGKWKEAPDIFCGICGRSAYQHPSKDIIGCPKCRISTSDAESAVCLFRYEKGSIESASISPPRQFQTARA